MVLVDVGVVVGERRGGISKGKARAVRRTTGSMMTLRVRCCLCWGVKGGVKITARGAMTHKE